MKKQENNSNGRSKAPAIVITLLLVAAVAVAGFLNWYKIVAQVQYGGINNAVVQYYNINSQKDGYQPVNINTETIAAGPGWVIVTATVDSKLADGSYDVAWNRLTLKQNGSVWEVQTQATIAPDLKGSSNIQGAASQKETFVAFTETPNAKYLAGPARQSFAMYPLDETKYKEMQFNFNSITSNIIFAGDKLIVESYQYQVNGKSVVCDVTYYSTLDGWKIVQVDQKTV